MATTIPSGTGRLVLGNNLSEIINGTVFNDTIYGYAGNDSINGFEGNDYIDGGLGNDTLIGGTGTNTLLGGAGDDFIDGSLGTNDVIFGGAGFDTAIYSSVAGFNTAAANGVEVPLLFLTGTAGADILVGTASNDTITGSGGPDTITTGLGNDTIRYTNINDGSTFLFQYDSNVNFTAAVAAGGFDIITDFTGLGVAGGDIFNFASTFTPLVNVFTGSAGSVFTPVQSGVIPNVNILPGSNRLFAYDTGVDTYLLYDFNTLTGTAFGNTDTRILARLVGVTGVATLNTSDFSFG